MPTNVDILIKGVAMCYTKDNLWKVIFPFDKCHTLRFVCRKDDEESIDKGHLARAKSKIAITIKSPQQVPTVTPTSSPKFDECAYDLTCTDSTKPTRITHPKVKAIAKWDEKAVLMTIENAKMFVLDFIHDFTDENLILEGNGTKKTIKGGVAHSFRARVGLNTAGESLVVTSDGVEIFSTAQADDSTDTLYTLIFDNNCQNSNQGGNDMEMFYKVIEDFGNPSIKFMIQGEKQGIGAAAIPPDLHGTHCMASFISKPEDPGLL